MREPYLSLDKARLEALDTIRGKYRIPCHITKTRFEGSLTYKIWACSTAFSTCEHALFREPHLCLPLELKGPLLDKVRPSWICYGSVKSKAHHDVALTSQII